MSEAYTHRWYDQRPQLAKAVRILLLMPDEIRTIMGEGITTLTRQEFEEMLKEKHYVSVGSEKIMGLHKSKNRRREYDQNEALHNALNYLYILSESGQDLMAEHMIQMLEYIQRYRDICQEFQQPLSLEEIAALTDKYIQNKTEEVEEFLKNLRNAFYAEVFGNNKDGFNGETNALITTQNNPEGMRVQKQDLD